MSDHWEQIEQILDDVEVIDYEVIDHNDPTDPDRIDIVIKGRLTEDAFIKQTKRSKEEEKDRFDAARPI